MARALPVGFTVRPPTLDDIDPINQLITACAIAEDDTTAFIEPYQQSDWEMPGFQRETDAWVVSALNGHIVGYGSIWAAATGRFWMEGYVHPQEKSRSIGTTLLWLSEARARQIAQDIPAAVPVTLTQEISTRNIEARNLLEQHGFAPLRHNWQMVIDLTEAPLPPEWPAGMIVRNVVAGQDEQAVYGVTEEAFAQNRGHLPMTFAQWAAIRLRPEYFDPSLWFLALDGTEPAGVVLCRYKQAIGWVSILAVRARWRNHGLGLALLRQAFGEFYRRGIHQVGLSVDSENNTGATRLYERAGMRVARQYDRYQKELRR